MYNIDDPEFQKLVKGKIGLKTLEKRLRPGASSIVGFIGGDESLLEIVHSDWQTVQNSGTSHQEIAAALKQLYLNKYKLNPNFEYMESPVTSRGQDCPWGCTMISGYKGILVKSNLSEDEKMFLFIKSTSPKKHMQVIEGMNEEFGQNLLTEDPTSSTNEVLYVALTDILPHLIEKHYFFEGKGSPYRADPEFLIKALNLGK